MLASSKRRRINEQEKFLAELEEIDQKGAFCEDENHTDNTVIANIAQSIEIIVKSRDKQRVVRKANVDRTQQNEQWTNGYLLWSEEEFNSRLRVHRETFEVILGEISPFITKTPTNFQLNPIEAHRQLALTLYRLAHACSYQVIEDVFGVSKALASETFDFVIRISIMLVALYNRYVALPKTIKEWKKELKQFIENYSFPCIGALDGFHAQMIVLSSISIPLTNMGLVRYSITNVSFMLLAMHQAPLR